MTNGIAIVFAQPNSRKNNLIIEKRGYLRSILPLLLTLIDQNQNHMALKSCITKLYLNSVGTLTEPKWLFCMALEKSHKAKRKVFCISCRKAE